MDVLQQVLGVLDDPLVWTLLIGAVATLAVSHSLVSTAPTYKTAVVVTGGTSGIGRALVYSLAKQPEYVKSMLIIAGRNAEEGVRIESELSLRREVIFVPLDL